MNFLNIDSKTKKKIMIIAITFVVILLAYTLISGMMAKNKSKKCDGIRDEIIGLADIYMKQNDLYPTLNGTSVTVEISKLPNSVVFKDKTVSGTITYTKYNDEYIKTTDITNAGYCSTGEFTKKRNGYDSDKNVKPIVTFNYYTVESYNSKWTDWFASESISDEETDGVLLPIDHKYLPSIPSNGVITEYVRETKTYYSYRDKQWKWYRNNINYSEYSSSQPSGYTNKDTATLTTTTPTEWSLDYPSEYSYRHIQTKAGYRWYYMDGKEKVYWENGKYSIESPGTEYKNDKDSQAPMYSYYDDMWKWYNGTTTRAYSAFTSVKPNNFNYLDEEIFRYTNWTRFTDTSYIDSSNQHYREEKTDVYSRYLIKYDVYSYPIFDNPVSLSELEQSMGKTYEEALNDKSIKIDVNFEFLYQ